MSKNYSRMYDDVTWLKKDITAELRFQAAGEYDLLPKEQTFPDMRMIKAHKFRAAPAIGSCSNSYS